MKSRHEQIEEAAEAERQKRRIMRRVWNWDEGFEEGAKWADANPPKPAGDWLEILQSLDGVAAVNLSEPSPGDLERVV